MDVAHFVQQIVEKVSAENLIVAGMLFATALGCALIAYLRTAETYSFAEFFEFAIPREVVTHPSARADLLFYITRKAIMPFLLIPAGVTFVVGVGYATNRVLGAILGIHEPVFGAPGPITVVIFTATMLLAYDVSYYLYHTAQHRYPFLWELHKVHHSAEVMVGITKDRVHPLDELMNRAWDGVIPGICFGIWSLVALNPVELTVFGINVYIMRNILMMDFVRHTHFMISFGPLNHIVLCPHWHQLHHSTAPQHYDKNFGLLFSFWDRLFGTLYVPEPNEDFKFGLVDRDVADYQSLSGLYLLPLKKMGRRITRQARRLRGAVSQPRPGA